MSKFKQRINGHSKVNQIKLLMSRTGSKQGSILIGVLWSLFFLASLALVINSLIEPQLILAARLRDRVTIQYLAEAGFKRALIEIRNDETEEYDLLNDTWSYNEDAFKDIKVTDDSYFSLERIVGEDEEGEDEKFYGLIDEERKININTASGDVLNQVFEIIGETSSQDAADISDSIVDWRDEDDEPGDNGAEASYYEGYSSKNSNFQILEELLLIKSMTQEIFDKVKGSLTVYGSGKVNINTADVLVLQGLGMRDSLAEKVIIFREGNDGVEGTEDDNAFDSIENAVTSLSGITPDENEEFSAIVESDFLTISSNVFSGRVIGGREGQEMTSEIVFVVGRDEKVRYWWQR